MDLALNNLKRVDMPLNKETNQPTKEANKKNWCGPKVGTQKENTEHGLEVRKIY